MRSEPVAVGDLSLPEILQGFRADTDFQRAKALLASFPFFVLGGFARAVAAAENFRLLRRQGITVRKTVDVFIATACVDYGFELLHRDRDFDLMAGPLGLRVAQPD